MHDLWICAWPKEREARFWGMRLEPLTAGRPGRMLADFLVRNFHERRLNEALRQTLRVRRVERLR